MLRSNPSSWSVFDLVVPPVDKFQADPVHSPKRLKSIFYGLDPIVSSLLFFSGIKAVFLRELRNRCGPLSGQLLFMGLDAFDFMEGFSGKVTFSAMRAYTNRDIFNNQ